MAAAQSFANHRRYVFGFHVIAFGLLMANLVWSVRQVFRDLSADRVVAALTAVALILVFFYARLFALSVQNRVIRLEERLRMARLLPEDLRGRIEEFSVGQLVALRFASDAELSALARRVLAEGIRDQNAIKRSIKEWRADYHRA